MADKIKASDLIDLKSFEEAQKSLNDFLKQQTELTKILAKNIDALNDQYKDISDTINKAKVGDKSSNEELFKKLEAIKELNKESKKFKSTQESVNKSNEEAENTLGNLKKRIKELKKEAEGVDRSSKKFNELSEEIRGLNDDIKQTTREFRSNTSSVRLVAGSYNALQEEQKKLRALLRSLPQDAANFNQVKKKVQENQKQLDDFNRSLASSGNIVADYGKGAKQVFGSLKSVIVAGLAIGSIREASQLVSETVVEVNALRKDLAGLAGGANLDQLTIQARTLSKVFGVDAQQLVNATNALTKGLGGDFTKNLKVIEKTLANVSSTQRDEILEQIKEYSVQAKKAGFSVEDLSSLLVSASNQGIFSDKGIDVIKEVSLRLTELTPATRDALEGIGLSATGIENALKSGTKSVKDIIQEVSTRLGELKDNTPAVQTAIADIFGGPGEDAGIEFLRSLKNIGGEIKELDKDQQRLINSTKALARVENDTAKQFKETQLVFTELGNVAKRLFLNIFKSAGPIIEGVATAFRDFLGFVNSFFEVPVADKLREEQAELNILAEAIQDTNTDQQTRNDLIKELNEKYPEFLGNLKAEEVSNQDIAKRLEEVNKQYEKKIKIAANEEIIKTLIQERDQIRKNDVDNVVVNKRIERRNKLRAEEAKITRKAFNEGRLLNEEENKRVQAIRKETAELSIKISRTAGLTGAITDQNVGYKDQSDRLAEINKRIKELTGENEKLTEAERKKAEEEKKTADAKKAQDEQDKKNAENAKKKAEEDKKRAEEARRLAEELAASQFQLQKFRIEREIELNQRLQDNVLEGSNAQKQLIQNELELKKKLITLESNRAKRLAKNGIEIQRITEETAAKVQDLDLEVEQKLRESNEKRKNSIAELGRFELDNREALDKALKKSVDEQLKLEEEKITKQIKLEREAYEERIALREQFNEIAKDLGNELLEFGIESINLGFENRINKLEAEKIALEEQQASELALTQNNAQAQAFIEAEFAQKKKQIDNQIKQEQIKQFNFNKALQAGEVITNTAAAVIAAVKNAGGLPLGIPAAIATGAIGAVQLARVLAQKAPGFYEGTEYLHRNGAPAGKDTIFIRANEGERIVSTEQNRKWGGISNEEATRVIEAHNNGKRLSIDNPSAQQKISEANTVVYNGGGVAPEYLDKLIGNAVKAALHSLPIETTILTDKGLQKQTFKGVNKYYRNKNKYKM